ncbi:ABC transporter ATP-binding protein [Arthrobacter sp. ZGTC131]|uniref:ABC transporter ATP-binding protein n=1 Tax=Arthrobacter sp. ZGTC131 TaxID=2058898 RepID=UPI000CE47AB8|nr:ABC transporter ATP-binding protein [Arthrobacter sp. ZGTC131]
MNGQVSAAVTLRAAIESFAFHGDARPALRDVEIVAAPGSLIAVLGGSGSGKSTLGRLLGGWLAGGRDGKLKGRLELESVGQQEAWRPLVFFGADSDPQIDPAAWAEQVGYVPQDPAAMLSAVRATVEEELAFGLENRGMERAEMVRIVAETARRTGLASLLERDPATLSGGELRRLAVGCAIVADPAVLILDEPLASLDADGTRTLTELVAAELARGTAVVVLSQSADLLTRLAEPWLVLEDGAATAAGPPDRILAGEELASSGVVVSEPSGAPSGQVQQFAQAQSRARPAKDSVPALELDRVSFGFGTEYLGRPLLLENVVLDVWPGEIVAVTGPNGAGKSTLLRLFNGLLSPLRGEVRIGGEAIAGVPTGVIAQRLGLLFQHPHDQLFERTVLREVFFGLDRRFGASAPVRAAEALASVGLSAAGNVHPHELSGSGQRLLALATVLAREPEVLALDEPTVALDAHGLRRLSDAMTAAAGRGAAVVLVTHDLAFARAHAHRLVELRNGVLAAGD